MFKTVARIIKWCDGFRRKLYIGFVFSFLSGLCMAAPVCYAGWLIGQFVSTGGTGINGRAGLISFGIILGMVLLRFMFDYLKARYQETISYELVARDRLAVGTALKRVSFGFFQDKETGTLLNSITTGLYTLENMGIRMIDTFVGGYLNFLCIFIILLFISPASALIAAAGVLVSLFFLIQISKHSTANARVQYEANEKLTDAAVEYVRGLSAIKSFGFQGAGASNFRNACRSARDISLKIEWGYIPPNCLHLFFLKIASVVMVISVMLSGLAGRMDFTMVVIFSLLSMMIFGSVEPISESAHVLSVIDNAMDQMDALSDINYMDTDGKDIRPDNFDIRFEHVDFSYQGGGSEKALKDVSFSIRQRTTTAIIGPSGSGKTTIARLIARFYDVSSGRITLGGHDLKEFTCDSLINNISMVFQDVYLFNDTVRANICFGKERVTEKEMIEAAKKAQCHDFIMKLPNGYDTVIGEGGNTLSGGEKQRISIARAILKEAPVIILDESTASFDPENEYLIQTAISSLAEGKTVLIIAHRLATIETADQILVMDKGKLVQSGTHEELIRQNGIYKDFVRIRQEAENWQI